MEWLALIYLNSRSNKKITRMLRLCFLFVNSQCDFWFLANIKGFYSKYLFLIIEQCIPVFWRCIKIIFVYVWLLNQ